MARRAASKLTLTIHAQPKHIIVVLALVLVLYVIVPQIGGMHHSLTLITHANWVWAVLGALCYLCTSPLSAAIYRLLAPRRLPVGRTVVVQYGSSFANRILPAGLGALGVGYFYLRKQRCTPAAALATVTLNNLLGTLGHLILLLAIVVLAPGTFSALRLGDVHVGGQISVLAIVVAVVGALLATGAITFRRRLKKLVFESLGKLVGYRKQRGRVMSALGCSMLLTLLYAACLYASSQALGGTVSLAAAVVILGIGVAVGASIPSPGGLGGAEAGLVAGLVAFGQSVPSAVAIAILFRLATYWLGFVIGAAMFFIAEKRAYF